MEEQKYTVYFYKFNRIDLDKWNKYDLSLEEAKEYVKNNLNEVEWINSYYVDEDNNFIEDADSWFFTDFLCGFESPRVDEDEVRKFLNYEEK